MIRVRGLKKHLAGKWVLNDLDIDIMDREIFTLLGGSGEGKSVFLKNLTGLMKPDGGTINIDGTEITELSAKKLHKIQTQIGMMFQGGALFDSMTVGDNVAFGMRRLTDYSREKISRMVKKYLEMVGLDGTEDKLPESLSIGMRRRVALARAIATRPRYILYDEPTTGLDPITTDVVCDLFLELQKELDVTSVIVTHDLKTAYKVSSRIGLLYEGKIVAAYDTESFRKSDNPYVKQFIRGNRNGPMKAKNGQESVL